MRMDVKLEFKNVKELYDRVTPALYSKVKELRKNGFKFVSERDLWNYLAEFKWKNKNNLELHEMIEDILYTDNFEINEFVMNKLNSNKKEEKISKLNIGGEQ